ncbi:MAG: MFS transporter [Candidatus Lokiarchaeota archaeon]|nr:MFS transporter [Candidatus Lokiarchaeota archaeon]
MSEQEFDKESSQRSFGDYLSFSMYQITWTIIVSTQGLFLFFFYHTVIGLDPLLIFLATAINTVWGAFNDPLIGYLTDRNFKWTRKLGRRFPWILTGIVPWCFIIIFIFSAPDAIGNPWPAFLWLLFFLFLHELFITLTDVHGGILRADKFRTEFERRKYAGFFGIVDMIAMALGTALPPLLLFGTDKAAYQMMAIIISMIALIFAGLFLVKGAREDKIIIDRYFASDYERLKFIKGTIEVLKHKNFLGFWISIAGFGIATTILTGMIVYVVVFLLQYSTDFITIFMAVFLIGAMVSVPFWLRILKKIKDSRKLYLIGCIVFSAALAPVTFFQTMIDLMILLFIVGFALGCLWAIQIPIIFSNIQDDFVIRTGRNQKGLLIGGWAVLGLFTAFIDELLITAVFFFTGFDAGLPDYAALVASGADVGLVLLGIRILIGVIPMCAMIISTIVFWKLYSITHEKVLENKQKLKELGF